MNEEINNIIPIIYEKDGEYYIADSLGNLIVKRKFDSLDELKDFFNRVVSAKRITMNVNTGDWYFIDQDDNEITGISFEIFGESFEFIRVSHVILDNLDNMVTKTHQMYKHPGEIARK